MVAVDPVTAAGVRADRAMPPGTQKMFLKHANSAGLDDPDFNYHPVCLCPYDKDSYTNKVKKQIHTHCRAHFVDAMQEYEPDMVVSLGVEATSMVMKRAVQITKVRGLGQTLEEFDGKVLMPMLHPGQALRYPENEPFLASDAAALKRLMEADGNIEQAGDVYVGKCEVVTDLQFLIDMEPELIAWDTETTGLDWYRGGVNVRSYDPELHRGASFFKPKFQILCWSFTVNRREAYILPWDHPDNPIPEADKPRLRNQIRKLMCRDNAYPVGHNLSFDSTGVWMAEGVRIPIRGDSLILAAVHDENAMNKDLASLTKIHVPDLAGYSDSFDNKYDKSRMWEVPWDEMVRYVGGDTIAAFELYEVLEDYVLQDKKNWNYYQRVMLPGVNAFVGLQSRGQYVDENALDEFQAYMEQRVAEQHRNLLAQVPAEIKRAHVAAFEKKGGAAKALQFTRAEFIRDILFYHPRGFKLKPKVWTESTERLPDHMKIPSTSSKDHLPYFFDECPFTLELAQHIKDKRLLETNIVSFRQKYVVGGKVRPKFSQTKAKTRRTNSVDPNGQNSPKRGDMAKRYQRIFKAPPGHYAISVDYSQAELRIAAHVSGDPVMINAYRTGRDIHVITACLILGITEDQFHDLPKSEQKSLRTKAKACIAEGSPTLVLRNGVSMEVPLEETKNCDLVWDGIEWVKHEGVEYQGYRYVMSYGGVVGTPEHVVCTEYGAMPLYLAREIGAATVEQTTPNSDIVFFYSDIENVPYLSGYLEPGVTGASLAGKAKGYGYKDIVYLSVYRHDAVPQQGLREVITHDGLTATPDHPVYAYDDSTNTVGRKVPFGDIASTVQGRQLVTSGVGSTPIRVSFIDGEGGEAGTVAPVRGDVLPYLQSISLDSGGQLAGGENHKLQVPTQSEVRERSSGGSPGGSLRCNPSTMQEHRTGHTEELWCAGSEESLREQGTIHQVHPGESSSRIISRGGDRSYRQQRPLRAGELEAGGRTNESSEYQEERVSGVPWREVHPTRHTGGDTKASPGRGVCTTDSAVVLLPRYVGGGYGFKVVHCEPASLSRVKTYDLINAGVNHRFTLASGATVFQCNFGYLYGMGWRSFVGYAKTQYGADFTDNESKRLREGFFRKYAKLKPWHEREKENAHRNKQVRSIFGLVRHLPTIDSEDEGIRAEAERQAVNSPIQEVGSSLGVMTLGRIEVEVDPRYLEVVGFIHDALVAYVPCEYLDWGMRTLKGYMESNPVKKWFGLDFKVPILAEASFGLNFGDQIEVPDLKVDEPYDFWNSPHLLDDDGNMILEIPEQLTPPNNGRRTRSPFDTDKDMEPEDISHRMVRRRRVSGGSRGN